MSASTGDIIAGIRFIRNVVSKACNITFALQVVMIVFGHFNRSRITKQNYEECPTDYSTSWIRSRTAEDEMSFGQKSIRTP